MVLLHSPLVGPATWGELPALLREQGYDGGRGGRRRGRPAAVRRDVRRPRGAADHRRRAAIADRSGRAQRRRPAAAAGGVRAARRARAWSARTCSSTRRSPSGRHPARSAACRRRGPRAPGPRRARAGADSCRAWSDHDLAAPGLGPVERATVLTAMRPRAAGVLRGGGPAPRRLAGRAVRISADECGLRLAARLAGLRGFAVVGDGGWPLRRDDRAGRLSPTRWPAS